MVLDLLHQTRRDVVLRDAHVHQLSAVVIREYTSEHRLAHLRGIPMEVEGEDGLADEVFDHTLTSGCLLRDALAYRQSPHGSGLTSYSGRLCTHCLGGVHAHRAHTLEPDGLSQWLEPEWLSARSLSPALALSYSLRQNLDTPRWAGARADAVSDMHSRATRRKRTHCTICSFVCTSHQRRQRGMVPRSAHSEIVPHPAGTSEQGHWILSLDSQSSSCSSL